ncbi:hypothetical protein MFRU_009g00580 [Monilinia fructicola]|nr:hypothetical protein MFRU_009g00580 [Monilinia fructicola]
MLKSLIVTLDKMAWSIGSPDGTWKALFLDLELSQELTRKMNDMTTTYLLVHQCHLIGTVATDEGDWIRNSGIKCGQKESRDDART